MLSVIMLSFIMLNVIILIVIMLCVIMLRFMQVECHYAERYYAKCHYAKCHLSWVSLCCVLFKLSYRCYGFSPKWLFTEPAIHRTPLVWAFTECPLGMGFHQTIYTRKGVVAVKCHLYGLSPNARTSGVSPNALKIWGFTEYAIFQLVSNTLLVRKPFGESP
jgi:hypothetical protein